MTAKPLLQASVLKQKIDPDVRKIHNRCKRWVCIGRYAGNTNYCEHHIGGKNLENNLDLPGQKIPI
jgi:hypothetical protein